MFIFTYISNFVLSALDALTASDIFLGILVLIILGWIFSKIRMR